MLKRLYVDETFKDITFRLDSGLLVKAHRCVLMASGSTFFERLIDPNSMFHDARASEITIRECSDDEFKFVMLSVYELDDEVIGITASDVFRLSARFDVSYRLSKFFSAKDSDRHLSNRELVELACEYRPLFDKWVLKLQIDVHSLMYDWSQTESKYSVELLTYLVSITDRDVNYFSIKLTNWLGDSTFPGNVSHLELVKPHKEFLEAILRKWDPLKVTQSTLLLIAEMNYLEIDEVIKLSEYKATKSCFVISSYPLKVGYIHKSKEPAEGEFVCYCDLWGQKLSDPVVHSHISYPVYRK